MDALAYRMMAATQDHHWWWEGRRQILRRTLTALRAGGLLPPGVLYDLGCGCGSNLGVLGEFGDAVGLDGSARAVEYARASGRSNVRLVDLTDAEAVQTACPAGSGAVVLLADVLEHLDAEGPALEIAGRVLAPNGCLLITVPALPMLWGPADDFNHHRRRYSRATLVRAVETRFTVERMSYFNTFLLPPIAVARWLGRVLRRPGHEELALPPAPVNATLRRVLSFESRLLEQLQ